MIEHKVDDHAGYGYVQPHRKNESCELFMLFVSSPEPAPQGDDNERSDQSGKDGMRGQDREIDRPRYALTCKPGRAESEVVGTEGVIGDI